MGMSKEAVRNDRNKKRKVKTEGCVQSSSTNEEMTEEEEELLDKLLKAHEETFPYLAEDDKYHLVCLQNFVYTEIGHLVLNWVDHCCSCFLFSLQSI